EADSTPDAAAAPRDADGVPGSVLVAQPAADGGPDHRTAVLDPQDRGQHAVAGPGADGALRHEPGALQPLSARVLRRPAAAHRRRSGSGAAPQADRLRRARLGTRRLDPGADPQPAGEPAERVRPDLRLHLARPLGDPPD